MYDLLRTEPNIAATLKGELFSTGLYMQRRAWHVSWGKSANPVKLRAQISTAAGEFIYIYKHNTIYGTDERGLLVSNEFALDKTDPHKLRFGSLCDRDNGVSFITDPETIPIGFHFEIDGRERPDRILLGNAAKHPDSGNFTLNKPVELTPGTTPPPGGILIWSEPLWVNFKQILRAEVGDPIQISPEVRRKLQQLGYVSGD